jgi:hypothetical protein
VFQNGDSQRKDYPPPVVGIEFESYDDAYSYYNCYAKDLGFAVTVRVLRQARKRTAIERNWLSCHVKVEVEGG